MARHQQLPDSLRPLFWDVEFRRLSPDRDQDYILLRIMEHGDLPAVRWLIATYGKPMLREWLVGREGRGLSRHALRFWEAILDLPHRQVSRWIRSRPVDLWDQRTHRVSTTDRSRKRQKMSE
jgi:hypothetical protein